jgi:hypothetical protein
MSEIDDVTPIINEFTDIIDEMVVNVNLLLVKYKGNSDPVVHDVLICIRDWANDAFKTSLSCLD